MITDGVTRCFLTGCIIKISNKIEPPYLCIVRRFFCKLFGSSFTQLKKDLFVHYCSFLFLNYKVFTLQYMFYINSGIKVNIKGRIKKVGFIENQKKGTNEKNRKNIDF